jgi:predicted ArsR family transcriptional regulator
VRTSAVAERHRTHEALAVASRVQLVDALRASERPLTAGELASACGLHVSTARFHLEILGKAGLVRSRPESTGRRGRPRLLYSPTTVGGPGSSTGPGAGGGYQLLATVLAANWGDTASERSQRAERAGRAAATAQHIAPYRAQTSVKAHSSVTALPMRESVAEVSGTFAELGFEPDVVPDGDGLQIRLHACPFHAVATQHPEVVCSVHLGLIRGALAELGGAATAVSLEPFVEPHLCVARIVATEQEPGEPGSGLATDSTERSPSRPCRSTT